MPLRPNWMADGDSFWYSESTRTGTVVWKVDPTTNTKERLFDIARVRDSLEKALGYKPRQPGLPFHDFEFVDLGEQVVRFSVDSDEFELRLADYKVTRVPIARGHRSDQQSVAKSRDDTEVLSPDGRWLAGISDYNIYVRSAHDDRRVRLTDDGSKDAAWGGNYFLRKRPEWSPDSSKIVAVKVDFRDVRRIPLTRFLSANQEVEWWPYPGARDIRPRTKFLIIDVESQERIAVNVGGKPDQWIATMGWRPNSAELFFRRTSRYGEDRRFMAASSADGSVREILNETQYGNIRNLRRLADGKHFICSSEVKPDKGDPVTNIDLFSLNGTHVHRIAERLPGSVAIVDVQDELNRVYFTTSTHLRSRGYLHCADLHGNKCTLLDETPGAHDFIFSPSKKFYLDTFSSPSVPAVTRLHRGRWQATASAISRRNRRPDCKVCVETAGDVCYPCGRR